MSYCHENNIKSNERNKRRSWQNHNFLFMIKTIKNSRAKLSKTNFRVPIKFMSLLILLNNTFIQRDVSTNEHQYHTHTNNQNHNDN